MDSSDRIAWDKCHFASFESNQKYYFGIKKSLPRAEGDSPGTNIAISFPTPTCVTNATAICGTPGVIYPIACVNITQILGGNDSSRCP
jgi:hypothetical protein